MCNPLPLLSSQVSGPYNKDHNVLAELKDFPPAPCEDGGFE
eukprot:gene25299-31739_t